MEGLDQINQDSHVKVKILRAAKKLFAKQGYEGTKVRQICDEAGVSLALVSYHFGGKENVFFELFDNHIIDFSAKANDLSDPVEALRAFIENMVAYRIRHPEIIHLIQQEMMMQSPRLDRLEKNIFPSWRLLRDILEAGKNSGSINIDSLEFSVHFVMGTLIFSRIIPVLEPVFGTYKRLTELDDPNEVAKLAISYIFNGLKIQ